MTTVRIIYGQAGLAVFYFPGYGQIVIELFEIINREVLSKKWDAMLAHAWVCPIR